MNYRHAARVIGRLILASLPAAAAFAQDADPPPATGSTRPAVDLAAIAQADASFANGDWPQAIRAYRELLKIDPENGAAWFRLGYALHQQGDYLAAAEADRRAAASPQLRATALYNLACALSILKEHDAAIIALHDAIAAGYQDIQQLSSDEDLTGVRGDPRFTEIVRRATPVRDLVRELDFWVGRWDVYNPDGRKVGESRIEPDLGGCAVIEHWTSMQGGTGQSVNFIDPADRRWRQVWVDSGGNVVRYEGTREGDSLRLAGTYTTQRGGVVQARALLSPGRNGRVHHLIEHSPDGGATWHTFFDGTYVRRDGTTSAPATSAPAAPSPALPSAPKSPSASDEPVGGGASSAPAP